MSSPLAVSTHQFKHVKDLRISFYLFGTSGLTFATVNRSTSSL